MDGRAAADSSTTQPRWFRDITRFRLLANGMKPAEVDEFFAQQDRDAAEENRADAMADDGAES